MDNLMENDYNNEKIPIPWKLIDLIGIFLLTIFIVFLIDISAKVFLTDVVKIKNEEIDVVITFVSVLVQNLALLSLAFIFISRKYNYSIINNLYKVKGDTSRILWNGIVGGVGVFFTASMLNSIFYRILHPFLKNEPSQQVIIEILGKVKNGWFFLAYGVIIVIIVPIVEETFFRGLIYTYFRQHYGVFGAYFLSAFLFGIMHQNLWTFLGIFLAGLALAYLFEESKTLFTPILAHMVWNGIMTLFLYYLWSIGKLV